MDDSEPDVSCVYNELRRLARVQMRRERGNHTLQPTALVNEAYMRLAPDAGVFWRDRAHFMAIAAGVMRRVLVDHARAHQAHKRGGLRRQVTLHDEFENLSSAPLDILALNEALDRLALLDQRQSKIVELHFFGGLSFEEIAEVLGVAVRTAKRDWSMARSWLHIQLSSNR